MSLQSPIVTSLVSLLFGGLVLAASSTHLQPPGAPGRAIPAVVTHGNRQTAGVAAGDEWHLALRAGLGQWRPGGDDGRAYEIEAFGEADGPLQAPAPLIRIRQGTIVVASVRNDLHDPLRVHGLCARDGTPCPPLDVPPGEARDVRFVSGAAGTYHYWATTWGMPLNFRGATDTQMSGAFIVDPADGPADDRIFVITEWADLARAQFRDILLQADPGVAFLKLKPDVLHAINGREWPYNERLEYAQGERVRWRVINLSTQVHPMHLHGFYFEAERLGDGTRDTQVPPDQRQSVVTQLMPSGSTMTMAWTAERPGNWLFHCHTMIHVSPSLHIDGSPKPGAGHDHHGDDPGAGMKGLVIGLTIRPAGNRGPDLLGAIPLAPARKLTLRMESEPRRFGNAPALGFRLAEGAAAPQPGPLPVPGPPIVLTRGEPVEITLVNRLAEATSIHWHGMELDSYYDGVHGWSGKGRHVTPLVEPGGTFVVRFTPPRAGTFIYHTHLHDNRQLTSGLYGALLVVEPGAAFDEAADHVLVIGRGGPAPDAPVVINGEASPQVAWNAGTRHRIRLINITPSDVLSLSLRTNAGPVQWRPLAKDGAALPADRSVAAPAALTFGVGETYDFEYEAPRGRQNVWLEVRTPAGKWLSQGHVIVR